MRSTHKSAFDLFLRDLGGLTWRQYNSLPDARRLAIHSDWLAHPRRDEYEALAQRQREQVKAETTAGRIWRGFVAAILVLLALVVLSQTAVYWR